MVGLDAAGRVLVGEGAAFAVVGVAGGLAVRVEIGQQLAFSVLGVLVDGGCNVRVGLFLARFTTMAYCYLVIYESA